MKKIGGNGNNNNNNNNLIFMNLWKIIENSYKIIRIYGFTKDPDTLNYVLLMEYTNKGSLKRCLTEITKNWEQKLFCLYQIIRGLNDIHKKDLIHYNFHNGNILCNKYGENIYGIFISDYLGLYQLAKSFLKENNIYGVLPFIAPEILRGQPYTQASDIYSFSIIMWEFASEILPFNDKAHDLQLALSICKGERPEIIENTPQCYIDLMKKCWDENPLKRPSSKEVLNIIKNWIFLPYNKEIEDINEELKSNIMEFINAPIKHNNLIVKSHPKACYTSHLLDFTSEELNGILEGLQGYLKLKQKYQSSQNELQNIQMELVLNQTNDFLKVKDNFLTLREEAIEKLQNCCNHLESSINKERNTIGSVGDMKISKLTDKYTKEFQNILVKYNDGLLELNKNYYSLKKIVQKNKELENSLIIENILKLNSFNLDNYKIFKFATNSQEGIKIQLNSNMMAEDINSLRKNLNELKLELDQEKKELKNLATV
ncbi:kinase-like domain-containing protein [Rhizophagus irregularis DAOM 181602=DAOM 197198]|uniref:Kinase-like domain-containing protein n=1 Tax=Rhizophagus irregularis (strain DAOM 181602 / DAOM 197198 / MUCL 43194) TaxID=747089 RepID=A0A2P4QUM4_RHIID|nr:kinase-like domain-containing protein [Rhizophagus irregularis DAOM 181602=DAOM 197198]POG81336.1 kinase-like domain-containing protein [Rhizophagus irregularis DAOM 181602=DAOM 197198]|eukprot:XP_025188202.1 kinase-like domain-containing protein [Rhizophagus irregularis DAOM 181602=DAOM 197198]